MPHCCDTCWSEVIVTPQADDWYSGPARHGDRDAPAHAHATWTCRRCHATDAEHGHSANSFTDSRYDDVAWGTDPDEPGQAWMAMAMAHVYEMQRFATHKDAIDCENKLPVGYWLAKVRL